jgi:hypothetical protein
MVAEPDAQATSQDHSVTGVAPCALPEPKARSRAPERRPSNFTSSSAFPSPVSRSDFAFVASPTALGSRKDADNANSYPTPPSHRVAAATGWYTPESRLNASGSAPAGAQLRRSLQENAFLHHPTGLIVRALGRRVRKRHFRKNAATCGGAEACVSEGHCRRDREWFSEPLGRDRCQLDSSRTTLCIRDTNSRSALLSEAAGCGVLSA